MINFTGLYDPTYEEPIVNAEAIGGAVTLCLSSGRKHTIVFRGLTDLNKCARNLEDRIRYMKELINSGRQDKETDLARSYYDKVVVWLEIYRHVYTPLLESQERPKQSVYIPLPEPASCSDGQFSLF